MPVGKELSPLCRIVIVCDLTPTCRKNILYLKEKMEESFSVTVNEHFGDNEPDGGGPPPEELEEALNKPDHKVYKIMKDGTPVGVALLKINEKTWI